MVSDMIKSSNDKRLYRSIELPNGLKALLVSSANSYQGCMIAEDHEDDTGTSTDDESDDDDDFESDGSDESEKKSSMKEKMAAAALAVRCGSFQDPPNLGGLAHYLEHMLFMGSEKYPGENEYSDTVARNGGSENAFTETDMTVFHFDISPTAFAEALDKFANFFAKPLLQEDALDREVQAVESEFQLQKISDDNRTMEVFQRQAGEHPMGKFFWGNLKSLQRLPSAQGVKIRDELVQFFNDYYSADRMTLCVQSRHSLDELESFVRTSFSSVPRRKCTPIVYPDTMPFSDNPDFCKLFKVVPIKESISMQFSWVLPSQRDLYKQKNLDYLGYAIGHEGKNGILDHLRRKQWALELEAGCGQDGFTNNEMCSIFTMEITLSETGAQNVAEVSRFVHQYIHMLRKKRPQEWLWNELRDIAEFDFKFQEEEDAQDYASATAVAMQKFPEEHFLCGDDLYFEYCPSNIQMLVDLMTPERCNTMFSDYAFNGEVEFFPLKEPWMEVPYKIEDYPESWRALWSDDEEFQKQLELPEPNSFIPRDFSICQEANFKERLPTVIHENDSCKLWYLKDHTFMVPKAHYSLHIITKKAYANIRNAVCIDLMTEVLSQNLARISNYAEMASLQCDINGYYSGLTLSFNGFNHKLPLFFEAVIEALAEFDCSAELFSVIRQELMKQYANGVLKNRRFGDEIRSSIIQRKYFKLPERLVELKDITRSEVIENTKNVLSHAFIEAYIHGNVTSDEAKRLIGVLKKFKSNPNERTIHQPHAIIKGEVYVRCLPYSTQDENSRIINYYVYGPCHFYEETLMHFLVTCMEEKCFSQLRTKQQLGYDAHCSMFNYRGVIGINISVSPTAKTFSLTHVDEKIDEFVDSMAEMIEKFTELEFNTTREALIKVKSCADLSMEEEQDRNWNQIVQFQYCFDRLQLEIEFLTNLRLEKFKEWSLKVLNRNGGTRDKLSVQVVGNGQSAIDECLESERITQFFSRESTRERRTDDTNAEVILVRPKDPRGKIYVEDLQKYLAELSYYEPVDRDHRRPFEL